MISVLSFGYLYWSSHNPDLKWNIVQQCATRRDTSDTKRDTWVTWETLTKKSLIKTYANNDIGTNKNWIHLNADGKSINLQWVSSLSKQHLYTLQEGIMVGDVSHIMIVMIIMINVMIFVMINIMIIVMINGMMMMFVIIIIIAIYFIS